MKKLLTLITFLLITTTGAATLNLDTKESKIGFSIIKFKIGKPVEGKFNQFAGKAKYDARSETVSDIWATIQVASIDTGIAKRDKHLKSDDFFSAEKIPTITFVATDKVKLADSFKLKGRFTMKGVTKNITLDAKLVSKSKDKVHFQAETKVNRLDYGITWNKTLEKSKWKKVFGILGKTVLDEFVTIKIDIKAKVEN